jgi:hypothetical protein
MAFISAATNIKPLSNYNQGHDGQLNSYNGEYKLHNQWSWNFELYKLFIGQATNMGRNLDAAPQHQVLNQEGC